MDINKKVNQGDLGADAGKTKNVLSIKKIKL